jgi:hypothetical protein
MQNVTLKKVYLLLVMYTVVYLPVSAQSEMARTAEADSLFSKKKYTESLHLYESILSRTGKSSTAMLLKMAFIEEGIGDYTKALYYLNLYYNQQPNEKVIKKMEELANAHELRGYQYDDINFIMIFYERYFPFIALALLGFGAYVFSIIISKKLRKEHIPVRHGIGFMIYLAGAFVFLNLSNNQPKGIVHRNNVYLMSAPSAGSKLVKVIQKGHRLEVLDKKDIWLEVKWDQQRAFIREQNVWLTN